MLYKWNLIVANPVYRSSDYGYLSISISMVNMAKLPIRIQKK